MDDNDDDDFGFDDDDLDLLPAHALHHLEESAWKATQHGPPVGGPESDYGLEDGDEVVNLDDGDEIVDLNHNIASGYDEMPRPSQNADATRLLARVRQLELDKAREKRQAEDLRGKLQTKAGEADTLRRRHDAESRRYERQMADQQQQHGLEVAKFKAEMERLRRDKEQAQTDTMFDQHDAREAGMAQRTRKAAMPTRTKSVPRTLHGDGFDEDAVVVPSPSRTRDRTKTSTPKHPSKRKRNATDQSPIPLPALQLSEPRTRPKEKALDESPAPETSVDAQLLDFYSHHDGRFALLHRLLSHPSSNSTDRILEALTQHAFPSQPAKKLSSVVYDTLSVASLNDTHDLALCLCRTFLDMWRQCLAEKFYAPVQLILDALRFVLISEPVDTAVELAEVAVSIIIASVDLVALPVSNAAKLGDKAVASLFSPTQRDIASRIDVHACLDLLHFIATSCASPGKIDALRKFWQAVPSSFAIMLLNKEFPPSQMTVMLEILTTSAITTTIGPIAIEDENQTSVEDALLNRLTNILTEVPKPTLDPKDAITSILQAASEQEILQLRLLVIMVLTHFSIPEHGCSRLAQNRLCVGRLIKYLDTTITSLYRQPLSPTQDQKVATINATMKLIYHITTSNPGFDMKSKLANTLGGQHAYLVALTRLAFSEGLVLEAGIEDAVVDMAHSILDEGLSMEEGEAFGMVFSSGNSV